MNIKVAAFTVSEKSINTEMLPVLRFMARTLNFDSEYD